MKHHKRHIHDWQWSEEHGRYLCACGESMLSEIEPSPVESESALGKRMEEPIGWDQPTIQENGFDKMLEPDASSRLKSVKSFGLEVHQCWSCYGSGYSDYAPGQPCKVCGGWGYWETI